MSPFPPIYYVSSGIYRFIPHPIYTGASCLVFGTSLYAGSAGGIWVISPLFILGCVALVMGYERENLNKRYPGKQIKPLISIPSIAENRPTVWNIVSAFVLVFLPWICLYQLVSVLGVPGIAILSRLPFEIDIPIIGMSVIFYMIAYPFIILAPFLAKSKTSLRNFMISGLVASAFGYFLMIIFPFVTPDRSHELFGGWQKIIFLLPRGDTSFTSFPAFHLIWTWIAVSVYRDRFPGLNIIWISLAILISISCIATGSYAIIDIVAGFLVYWFARYRYILWHLIQKLSESIANSWKEWDLGRIRLMNHGIYGGLATFTGVFMAGTLIGEKHLPAILVVVVTSMIVAALWAQYLEGSKKLLRPLGFYGGVIGIILGCYLVTWLFSEDFFLIWTPFAVAAPWIQAIGRLRCLVQGCCHGSPTHPEIGIRYFHHRSRVTRLSDFKGEYLHPTPVYSILINIVTGILLLKMWLVQAPLPMIIGFCFILNGLGRFVEESYRGEPQTLIIGGMRLYQWIALTGIIIGAFLTTYPYYVAQLSVHFNMQTLLFALVGGLIGAVLTGVDFPRSDRRFSRLV
jgi:hypothetical protein